MQELLKYCTAINIHWHNANVSDSEIVIMADFSIKDTTGVFNYAKIHARGKTYEAALNRAKHLILGYASIVKTNE